ncbi:HupE / UreJ protein [Filimonas lacunae]|uniref:HupE / UreJ protein n=1 Tax=Filimonas lacunae TaxID=477680 RepID=A0A1N7R0V2_9BACT|nr:HupE/UreJ family protein [Filimonas lacunae]SIT28654.1 HupE / UreJ protein [Filimonas lacunae]
MSDFGLFFQTGVEHITDLNGIDHILFVTALCLRYVSSDWKKLLILITAFTIGHSITLALSTLNIIWFSRDWTEFLIATTIVITALSNLFAKEKAPPSRVSFLYMLALVFGLIHGLGFSSLLKSMLGRDESIVTELLAFNLGLEAGQLCIVVIILLLSFIFIRVLHIEKRAFLIFVSGGITALALQMMIARIPVSKDQHSNEKTVFTGGHGLTGLCCTGPEHPKQPWF